MSGNFNRNSNNHGLTNSQKSFIWTIAAIVSVAALITLSLALVLTGRNDNPTGVVAGEVNTPTSRASATLKPTVAGATQTPQTTGIAPTPTATAQPTTSSATAVPTTVGQPATTVPANSASPTASPNNGTPSPSTSSSHPALAPAAAALAEQIESQYGVRIVDAGQDWGTTSDLQVRNIGAIRDALAGLPRVVRVTANARMPLAYLSNHSGATEAGWEPYGDREANYYTNEDVTSDGHVSSNQIVLQPGSNSQTIAHEMMHAYQMRDVSAGQYAQSLLTPDMKSFMAATGWTQLVSDDDVRNAGGSGWTAINAMFSYNGRTLSYTNQFGDSMTLFTPNPIEAFAEAGGLYYGHDAGITVPAWPEYWDWFASHTG